MKLYMYIVFLNTTVCSLRYAQLKMVDEIKCYETIIDSKRNFHRDVNDAVLKCQKNASVQHNTLVFP